MLHSAKKRFKSFKKLTSVMLKMGTMARSSNFWILAIFFMKVKNLFQSQFQELYIRQYYVANWKQIWKSLANGSYANSKKRNLDQPSFTGRAYRGDSFAIEKFWWRINYVMNNTYVIHNGKVWWRIIFQKTKKMAGAVNGTMHVEWMAWSF